MIIENNNCIYRNINGIEKWWEYNENGNKTHYKDSYDYEMWWEYDENGNKTHTKDSDGFYYFGSKANKTALQPAKTSSSFIKSVKFNENIEASLKETVSADGKTITYTSTGDGYDNATYTLTIRLDTIQYDQANNIWK